MIADRKGTDTRSGIKQKQKTPRYCATRSLCNHAIIDCRERLTERRKEINGVNKKRAYEMKLHQYNQNFVYHSTH